MNALLSILSVCLSPVQSVAESGIHKSGGDAIKLSQVQDANPKINLQVSCWKPTNTGICTDVTSIKVAINDIKGFYKEPKIRSGINGAPKCIIP